MLVLLEKKLSVVISALLQISYAYAKKMEHFQTFCKKGKLIILLEAIILRSNPFEIP
jgi:hypothetical protein